MFELLGGRPPFTASSPNELLTKHLHAGVPSLAPLNEAVTPEFNELVRQMMAKERDQRFQDMDEFLKAYRKVRVYKTGMKPRPPKSREVNPQ